MVGDLTAIECDVLLYISDNRFTNQRELSLGAKCSLGAVNRAVKSLMDKGLLDISVALTEKANGLIKEASPKNAVILAAGFGMRMVPINTEVAKGLIEVNGEPLIERLIRQLHEAGIFDICIVVGFMKEKYEYLIDEYGVKLIVNREYATTNNLHSLRCAVDRMDNSYIVPCDLWFRTNPFRRSEAHSWYMVADESDISSDVAVNRKGELIKVAKEQVGNRMIGVSYITHDACAEIKQRITEMSANRTFDNSFWEEALYRDKKMVVRARVVGSNDVVEINTFEQLRDLDAQSKNLKTDALNVIIQKFGVGMDGIKNITVLKKGMTNRSFLFECNDKKYIMRIPGEGTSELIDRSQEHAVYEVLDGKGIGDNVLYFNADSGYKITEYWQSARVCDPADFTDVGRCMDKLRQFHALNLRVGHEFDLFGQIDKYERLRGNDSVYRDYDKTKQKVLSLKPYIDAHACAKTLTHIDAVPDNFLFVEDGGEQIKLIDWEYAGMQDPHVDIAMFCIYAMYDERSVDKTIDLYFKDECPLDVRAKIYCYFAVCGLLWSNWCEYKRSLGVDFGEYSLAQYRFAKVYSDKALRLMGADAHE